METILSIKTSKDLAPYIPELIVINQHMNSISSYTELTDSIYDLLKASFERKRCREYPVKFKFYKSSKEIHTLELRHFFINLCLWSPLVNLKDSRCMDDSFIMDCTVDSTNKGFINYYNDIIIPTLLDYNVPSEEMNVSIAESMQRLRNISLDFSLILGLTINTEVFLDLDKNNKRFHEITETTFPDTMQPIEIEEHLNDLMNEELEIFKNDKNNPIGIMLKAGSAIKDKQLREMTVSLGEKPSLQGETIPIVMNNSTLKGGLSKPAYMYLDALGARKSMIMNHKVMGSAGYFSKIILMLARTVELSRHVYDCGSKHLIRIEITDKKVLNKFDGRYYRVNENDPLHVLHANKDTHLIGKVIYLRSPATCCAGENHICSVCYGKNASLALSIAEGIAAFLSEEMSKALQQLILSAKHLLSTKSEKIEFNPEFDMFFSLVCGEIVPILSQNTTVDNIDDWSIYVDPDSISRNDEFDDDSAFNTSISSGLFYVKNSKTGEVIPMSTTGNKELFINDVMLEALRNSKGNNVKFKDLEEDEPLFIINIINNELTKPLYNIMDVLNKRHDETYELDSIIQKMVSLLCKSNIDAMSNSAEVIINRIIRRPDDIYERPDFSGKVYPEYTFLTASQALLNNKSPLIGLSFQNLGKQIMDNDLFTKKRGTSYLDAFYRKKIRSTFKKPKK